jgi:hypothetical protein
VVAVAARLPPWQGHLMSKAGRVTLTKTTLLAISIYTSITMKVAPSIYHAIDKICRSFIWSGSDAANGGQCTIVWEKVTRLVELDGLGVTDLTTLGYALRLQWEWFAQAKLEHLAPYLPMKVDHILKSMCNLSMIVVCELSFGQIDGYRGLR